MNAYQTYDICGTTKLHLAQPFQDIMYLLSEHLSKRFAAFTQIIWQLFLFTLAFKSHLLCYQFWLDNLKMIQINIMEVWKTFHKK